jgi:OOP family OmpA-OmpF porin
MKTNLKKATMLLAGLMAGGTLFAQSTDSLNTTNYVKPFSGGGSFRTWSIGVHGGLLTPFTIFGANNKQDFTHPTSELGYGGYIKKQFLPGFALQADFLAGKVSGTNGRPNDLGVTSNSSYETKMNWSAALQAILH